MALLVSNVNVQTKDGDTITSFWIRVQTAITEKPTTKVGVSLSAYRSEAAHDSGLQPLSFIDTGAGLATDVPSVVGNITDDITVGQYANLDMTTIHNLLRDILIEGDSHTRWADLFGTEVWAGFGALNVVTEMPA